MLEGNFHFKGGRDYLQSASVFDFLADWLSGSPEDINFVFNHRTGRNPLFAEERQETGRQLIGSWRDSARKIYIYEGTSDIKVREPYDEAPIVSRCSFSGDTVNAPINVPGYSFMEICVAAYKHLLQKYFQPDNVKYVFVRMNLEYIPTENFSIRYARKVAGEFFQGDIAINENIIGRIFYGVWK